MRLVEMALRLWNSDRAPLPTEWDAQPARFVAAYRWLRKFMQCDREEADDRRRLDAATRRRKAPDAG